MNERADLPCAIFDADIGQRNPSANLTFTPVMESFDSQHQILGLSDSLGDFTHSPHRFEEPLTIGRPNPTPLGLSSLPEVVPNLVAQSGKQSFDGTVFPPTLVVSESFLLGSKPFTANPVLDPFTGITADGRSSSGGLNGFASLTLGTTPRDSLLQRAVISTEVTLQSFFAQSDWQTTLSDVFGQNYDQKQAQTFATAFAQGDFSALPTLEVLPNPILSGARGGYDSATDKIYLSDALLNESSSLELIKSVLLEEIGHSFDAKLNAIDTPGDEGELFSDRLQGIALSEADLLKVKTEDDHATIWLNGVQHLIEESSALPNFAIRTEGSLRMNGGGDLDGDPLNLQDDALVYAAKGFTINGNATLPVQRDANGNIIRDASGKAILVPNALTVATGYTSNKGPTKDYAGIDPPSVISPQTIDIPTYASLLNQTLSAHVPSGTPEVIFNAQTPLNTVSDWNSKFPSGGTVTNPKVVHVTNGGLNIPGSAVLSNTVIKVDTGDINFNGSGQNFTNVVLIATNGNINLNNSIATDLSAFASGSINVNGSAKLGGTSLLATGTSNGSVTFNGSTKTMTGADQLQVIAQGNITYNGSSDTRGSFLTAGTFTFNGSSTLYGNIAAKSDITFNGNTTVTWASIRPFNQAPTDLGLSPTSIAENVAANSVVGTLNTTDPDANNTFTYSLVSGGGDVDNSAFSVVGNQLKINGSPNYEAKSSYSIRVRTIDQGGLSFDKALTISVTDVNEAPTNLALSNGITPENVAAGSAIGTFTTTDPDANNTFTYSLVSGTGSTDNAAFSVVGNQLRINASPDFESKSSYSVLIRTTDQGGLSTDKAFVIGITDVNEAPTNLAISNALTPENVVAGSVIGSFTTTDPDANNTFTYSLVTGTGSTDNAAFSIVGNQLKINASPNFEAQPSYSIRVRTTDQGGLSTEKALTIAITDVNEAPTNLVLSNTVTPENVAAGSVVGNFTTTDPDANNIFTYSLVAGTGATDNAAFSIVGNQLKIVASPNFEAQSSYSIRVRTVDQGGLSYEKAWTVGITDINEAPITLALSLSSTPENVPAGSVIGTFTSTDPDANNTFTYSLVSGTGATDNAAFSVVGNQLKINDSPNFEAQSSYSILVRTTDQGGLSVDKAFSVGITDVNEAPTNLILSNTTTPENVAAGSVIGSFTTSDPDTNNTFTYSLVAGTGATDNAAFSIVGNLLKINASPNFEAQPSYSIRVKTTDQGGSSYEKALVIGIIDINEAPTNLVLSNPTTSENVTAGSVIGSFTTSDPDANNTFIYSLVSGTGSTDNAAFSIVGNQLKINASPNFEAQSSYSILVRTTDQGGLGYDKIFTVGITDLNEAPTALTLSNNNTPENVAVGSVIGSFTTTDPDANNTFTYSLVTGTGSTDNAAFSINGNQLKITASPNFEAQPNYSIRVRTTDQGGLSTEQVLGITVTDVNEAPTNLTISNAVTPENVTAGSVIGTLSTTDPDANNTFTYSLVAGNGATDNAAFTLNGNQLKINASPDFETKSSYSVLIRTTDQGGLSVDKAFVIGITDVNEAPTNLVLSNNLTPENVAAGSIIGSFTTTDPDANNTFTYSLVSGAGSTDNTAFSVSDNQLKINASPDFEAKSSYSIRVRTTDQGGLSTEQALTILVTDINEAPTDLNLNPSSIAENVAPGSPIGSFTTTDPDANNTFSYSLVSGIGATDNAAFSISGNQLKINASPDFEAKSSYSIRVRTTDQGGLSTDKTLVVGILNVNEAPTAIALTNLSIPENSVGGTVIGQLSTVDPDLNDIQQYSLTDSAGDRFEIVGNTLRVKAGAVLDFETTPQLRIEVKSTDAGGLSVTQRFAISLSDVNEAPTLSPIADRIVDEGSLVSFSAAASDVDRPSQSLNYSLESAPVAGVKLDPTSGLFTWTPTEAQGPGTYTFTVKVSDGALSDTKNFNIQVAEVNSAPVLGAVSDKQILLGQTLTLQNTTTDGDLPANTLTYSLGDGSPAGAAINPATGLLNWTPTATGDFLLTVRVTDNGTPQLSDSKTIQVQVLSPNHAPTALALSPSTILENVPVNTVVGNLSTTDSDIGNTFTYLLVSGEGDTNNSRFSIVGNQLKIQESPDFERQQTYSIRVRTTDQGGLSTERPLVISVANVNEAPAFTSTLTGTATADVAYEYRITTTDPENDARSLTVSQLPSWMTFHDNGDGTASLKGTPSFANAGLFEIKLTVTETSTPEHLQAIQKGFIGVGALLKEQSDFAPERTISLAIPEKSSILSFKINPLTFDLTDTKSINDAFEVSLVDSQGKSLLPTLGIDRESFFNWTEGLTAATAAGTTFDAATGKVNVNLTGIAPGTAGNLVFRLVNDDADTITQVRITDLSLIDAPTSIRPPVVTGSGGTSTLNSGIPVEFNHLADVTPSVVPQYQVTTFNDQTKVLYADVALQNKGTYAMDAPLIVAVNHISDPSVQLRDPDGFTPDGLPFYNFSALVADGKLDQGELSNARSLEFYNPNKVQFTYDLVVLAAVNLVPVIQTQPSLEVIGGQPYRYDLNATDPEQDSLTYKLVQSPNGMAIDPQTGVISWNTKNSDVGNHNVKVEVNDGRGGVSEQSYTLVVTAALPNRPPIFTSIPEVDAYINKLYQYDSDAIDPDQDNPLSFSLVIGPNGMKVNSTTGVVEWTPPPSLILGDTVLGRIGVPGENDEFTFSGMKGQRIYFDPLQYSGDYSKWRFDVYSPSGRKVIDGASLRWDDNRLLNLDENGNYKIVVDAQGEHTGSYGFSVIDLGLVPEVPFDTVVKGSLSPGSEDDVYRFSGRQGQKLYFDQLSKSGSMDWVIYNSSNQVVASNYNFDDMEVDLPADGNYILSLRGSSGFASIVDYSFNIVTPELTTDSLPMNQVMKGSISEKGEQDTYTFKGFKGQQIFFDALGGDYLPIRLYDPTGRQILDADSRYDRGPDSGLTFTMDGTYRVVVDGYGEATGNYSFRFLDRANATEIALDTDITGTFDNGGLGSVAYRFTLSDTKYLFADGQGGNGGWILYGPNGRYITSQNMSYNNEFWLGAGDYFLVAQGYGGGDLNYKLRLITPELATTPMNVGETVSGSIGEKGEQDTYTFMGTAGQQLFFDALGGDYSLNVYIYDPSGRSIFSNDSRSDRGPDSGLTLSTSGLYRVVVDGNDESVGNYSFRFLDRANATEIALDTDITGTFDNGGLGSVAYRFTLSDTKYLFADGQGGNGGWILYGPNGRYITSQNMSYNNEFWLGAGDYFLVAQGYGGGDLNYKLRLITPELATTPMNVGEAVSGSIGEKGEQDTYTFTGTAGQQLFFDALGGDYNLNVYIYDPSGRNIFGSSNRNDAGPDSGLTLSTSGLYRVVVDGNDESVGNYSFRFLDRANATEIALDTDITGTFDNGGLGSVAYRFTLSDTKYLFADGQGGNGGWILYGPNGRYITSQNMSYNNEFWLGAGDYFLVAQGYGGGDLNYKLRLITPELATTPMNVGETVSGSIGEKGEQDTYTFTGTAGQQLFFDALGGDYNLNVYIYDPSGRNIFGSSNRNDAGPDSGLTLSTSGLYRVVVDGNDESVGNYSFRFLDRANATEIALDTNITGTFDNSGLGSAAYRFTLNETHTLFVDGQGGNGAWILYGPNGRYISSQNLSYDQEIRVGAGDYFLVTQGYGGGDVNYKLRLTDRGNTAPTTIVGTSVSLGNVVSGSITVPANQDSYTFNGSAGQQLFYDALGGNYYLLVRLYDPSGREIFSTQSPNDQGPDAGLTLTSSGTYRVVVEGNTYQTTGAYKFRFLDRASARSVELDTDITGTFDNSGQGSDIYHFTLTDSRYLYVDGLGGGGNWIIYGPNGQRVASQNISNDQEFWLGAGDYFLVAQGYDANNPNYRMRIITPELNTAPMTLGQTISGSISEKGEQDTYTFTGTAGQQLFFDSMAGEYYNYVSIYDPSGRQIFNTPGPYDQGPDNGLTLSMTGPYRVIVDGQGETTGAYKFRFLDRAAATKVELDTDITGTFDNSGQGSDIYHFTLTDSRYLYVDGLGGGGNWIIYGPNGQRVASQNISNDQEFWLGAGDYFLVAQGYDANNPNYRMRIITPELNTAPMTLGQTISGSISEKGEQDTYTFTGTAGQQLFFDSMAGEYYNYVSIYDPSGRQIFNTPGPYDQGPDNGLTLSMTGPYRVIVDGQGETTGAYKFRFLDRASARSVELDTDITGTFDNSGQGSDIYHFTLTDSRYLYVDGLGGGGNWIIYGPNGPRRFTEHFQ